MQRDPRRIVSREAFCDIKQVALCHRNLVLKLEILNLVLKLELESLESLKCDADLSVVRFLILTVFVNLVIIFDNCSGTFY